MKYEIMKAANRIYWMKFVDSYDMSMCFCRYQEFYESPNDDFRGRRFQLLKFMEWYAKEHDGVFSYPVDWDGFNIPSYVLDKVWDLGISDMNIYDIEMAATNRRIKEDAGEDYYLIASANDEVFKHEFAHGCFYTTQSYKDEMTEAVLDLPPKVYKRLTKHLKKQGYTKLVFTDEIQAYLAEGVSLQGKKNKKIDWEKVGTPFRKIFDKYNKHVPAPVSFWKNYEKI